MNEREYHDRHYEAEAAAIQGGVLFRRVHDRAAREFLRAAGVDRSQRVLSLGCGDGSIEERLAPHAGEIVGLDLSAVAIEQARARCVAAGIRNATFVAVDRLRLEPLGQFDAVAAFAFLHHLADPAIAEVLRGARAALRPGGVFYSSDPSRGRLIGLLKGLVRRTYDRYHSPDERELDPRSLAALATEAGFAGCAIGYVDYFLGPLAWLAPGTPRWLAPALEALDNLALGVPIVDRYASSFSLLARAP